MQDNSIVNVGGTFMAIDLNIEHMIGYIKVHFFLPSHWLTIGLEALYTQRYSCKLGSTGPDFVLYQVSHDPEATHGQ